ncbi:hypothetical protein [Catellatospora sp. NPDC049133]|uniref:hypothetical protein n=1 Tax=Catellatospora sp. NPDC049133 TaxID=3155499 RepID=UPI0033C39C0D
MPGLGTETDTRALTGRPVASRVAGHRWVDQTTLVPAGEGRTTVRRICGCGRTWWPWENGWPTTYLYYCQLHGQNAGGPSTS